MRKIIAGLVLIATLIAGIGPAIAQAPPPVPALPDLERRSAYTITAQTGPFDVNFALFGSGTDYGSWVEVWLNGVMLTPVTDWTLALTAGSLATAARPMTNARVTLTAARTGTLQIVGAERPRRLSQFAENRGVAARDVNQVITGLTAQNRETWNRINDVTGRTILVPPGDTLTVLPSAATRANKFLMFDGLGNPALNPGINSPINSIGIGSTSVLATTNRYGFYNNNGSLGQSPRTLWATDAPYGALCNSVTDDSAAFNLLIADAIATGWPARFRGACKASFTISNSVDFGGVLGASLLIPATAGTVGISVNTPNAVYLHDFEISHSAYGGASSGVAGITVTATGTENGFSTFSNLILDFGFYGISFQRASSWTLVNTKITNSVDSCVLVQNLNVADSGDSTIDNTVCTPGSAAVAGIRFLSSSGLRIINSKINGTNLPVGISVELPASTVLADLFVTGNSIELHSTTGSGIKFTRTGAASFLGNVHIVGNEFGLLLKCVDIPNDANGPWLQAVAIAANTCIPVNSATAVAYNIDATTAFNVSGGVAQSFNAGTKVYVIGPQATKGVLGPVAKLGTFAADTIAANSIDGAINAGGPVMANYTANAAALAAAGFTAGNPNAKATTASFPLFTSASNDASNPLQLQISMGTHATAGSRSIDFNIVEPTVAYRQFNLAASLVNLSQGGLQSLTFLQTGTTTVGSLPACGAGTKGQRYFVTDANSTTFHATAAGGGANNMGVTCDGTNWYISANDNDPFWASRKFA